MRILAIETSCDETAVAIIEGGENKKSPRFLVRSNIVSSQVAIHKKWGGVVPNIAKREHQKNLVPVLMQALKEAGSPRWPGGQAISKSKATNPRQAQDTKYQILNTILERESELLESLKKKIAPLPIPNIDAIAVTQGPGLEPALWVGVNLARALSFLWRKPLLGINHMEGHIAVALLGESKKGPGNPLPQAPSYKLQAPSYPAIVLLVSGGHTELVLMKKPFQYKVIGETRDDAAGEAFDKVAKMLGLGYPGGPEISAQASKAEAHIFQLQQKDVRLLSPRDFRLPRPMINSKDFDFSFSGLKTAVLYLVRGLEREGADIKKLRPALAREFQDAVVDVLVAKTIRAATEHKVKSIILGGGVAANRELRDRLATTITKDSPNSKLYLPDSTLTGDNALMIASTAYLQLLHNKKLLTKKSASRTLWKSMRTEANIRLS